MHSPANGRRLYRDEEEIGEFYGRIKAGIENQQQKRWEATKNDHKTENNVD
jgi:hypothetical protein